MRAIKEIMCEEDFEEMKAGEWVMINGRPAMKGSRRGDGVDYLIPNGNGTLTRINLRGYDIVDNGINPIWHSEDLIDIRAGNRS